ncbi:lysophospholipid acyltransferase family protein [Solitalea canadensis]|uniref:Lauroyl/myristoyl acyltransferase n=1 Tax=Solitalea canadensis (strain ATCC 29591 / DSM 3403 / JCM 21819 / LMG 8368 / NBRC 15130 / NCIMB 12057 / USAM 9D) TaxID=929556 RepID=H8KQ97_SOLCM|nr:lysophospholipid acyltransferase family protein [Solitalea canadensis]AFD06392.1 Lauroyl/myristoyl acyltransferase [Solitalea canadensis DSM 3403]
MIQRNYQAQVTTIDSKQRDKSYFEVLEPRIWSNFNALIAYPIVCIYHTLHQLLYKIIYLLSMLPLGVLNVIERILYFLVFNVFHYRNNIVLQNLSRSFPEKSYAEINEISKGFYKYFLTLFMEMFKMISISEKQMLKQLHVINPQLLDEYSSQGRNIILMLGHYGNWESLNILPKYFSLDFYAVYKPLSNKFFDNVIKRMRSRFGMKLLPMDQAARFMLLNKEQSNAYILISDQSPTAEAKYSSVFLNQPTYLFTGVERLAKAINAVVIYAELNNTKKAHCWEVSFSVLTETPMEEESFGITQKFTKRLEQTINNNPSYWLWSHKRWKHKPQLS